MYRQPRPPLASSRWSRRTPDHKSRRYDELGRLCGAVLDAPQRQAESRGGERVGVLGDGGESDTEQAGNVAVVVPDERQYVRYNNTAGPSGRQEARRTVVVERG